MDGIEPESGKDTGLCDGFWVDLLPLGRLPGALAGSLFESCLGLWLVLGRHAWASGSTDPEKIPAFFEFAGTFFMQG